MAFLADDELHGRGSATRDEHIAALFAAAQFLALGLAPGGDNGTFLQKVALPSPLPPPLRQRLSQFEDTPRTATWNAIAILRGTDPAAGIVLLTAHLDHLGIGPANSAGDTIYNGADLEFEMIGRPDPAVPAGMLWLTGFDRSNLGPELARHGARLVADPHPSQNFFQRSDNFALARQGIIAQTVSSYGLHKDYHQPSDDLAKIDFNHLDSAIASMVDPIRWLADTAWRPTWNPGGKP
jgi:Zn-dependent M28 family amino/carboxypeptidase